MRLAFWRREDDAPPERRSGDGLPWHLAASPELLSQLLDLERAVGLPALLGVISRVAHGFGMTPQIVYRGAAPERFRARDSWQWELLHKRPGPAVRPFNFRADLATSLLGMGNAYVRKYKLGRGEIGELAVQDPKKFKPKLVAGQVVYEDRSEGSPVVRTSKEIIHVRLLTLPGKLEGLSPITLARIAIRTGLKRQRFEANYFDADASPGGFLGFPQSVTATQIEEMLELWKGQHQGVERSHEPAVLGGGAEWQTVPISFRDAQFVQSSQFSAAVLGAMYGVPKSLIFGEGASPDDMRQFTTFGLGPILTAVDEALNADEDLFPRGSDLMVETLAAGLLRPDDPTRYRGYKDARQGGWITPNEIRGFENLPPVEGGDQIQITPVGGAPNEPPAGQVEDGGEPADEE